MFTDENVKYTLKLLKIGKHDRTVVLKIIQPPDVFPMTSIVNKSCNIECCVNSMFPINQNMIVSQGLELILSMFRRTTMSGQHPLI